MMTEINKKLISELFDSAVVNPRLRQNFDLRNPDDNGQRILSKHPTPILSFSSLVNTFASSLIFKRLIMAVTSKDIEILWSRYQSEGVSKGVSVTQFFEANGIPYHVFEKWYKKRYRQPDVVECQVEDDSVPAPSSSAQQAAPVTSVPQGASLTVSHITICLSNGMRIDHHKLGFEELVSFIKKLEPLCLA